MPIVTAFWGTLLKHYGQQAVVDVLEDIGMAQPAADHGMGAWVVRGAIGEEDTLEWHRQLIDSLTSIADRDGVRSVHLKGSRKVWYCTIQCTPGGCTCKYDYEGTAKQNLFKVNET